MLLQVSILSFYFIFIISRKSKTNTMNSSSFSSSLHYITPLSLLNIHRYLFMVKWHSFHHRKHIIEMQHQQFVCCCCWCYFQSIMHLYDMWLTWMTILQLDGIIWIIFSSLLLFSFFFTHFYLYSLALFSIYIIIILICLYDNWRIGFFFSIGIFALSFHDACCLLHMSFIKEWYIRMMMPPFVFQKQNLYDLLLILLLIVVEVVVVVAYLLWFIYGW